MMRLPSKWPIFYRVSGHGCLRAGGDGWERLQRGTSGGWLVMSPAAPVAASVMGKCSPPPPPATNGVEGLVDGLVAHAPAPGDGHRRVFRHRPLGHPNSEMWVGLEPRQLRPLALAIGPALGHGYLVVPAAGVVNHPPAHRRCRTPQPTGCRGHRFPMLDRRTDLPMFIVVYPCLSSSSWLAGMRRTPPVGASG